MSKWYLEVLGLGLALTSMGWILGHLIAFAFLGSVLVGEPNRAIDLAEIGLISVGIFLVSMSYVERLSGSTS